VTALTVTLFQFIPLVFNVQEPNRTNVELVVVTVPVVRVKVPVVYVTDPEIVIVPAVLIVIFVETIPPPDQLPVPLNVIVLPEPAIACVATKLPERFMSLVAIVNVVPLQVRVPEIFKVLERVRVNAAVVVTLFQVIPEVSKVAADCILNVDPVVVTAPVVYVKIPVR
jgi:hypothetical protein